MLHQTIDTLTELDAIRVAVSIAPNDQAIKGVSCEITRSDLNFLYHYTFHHADKPSLNVKGRIAPGTPLDVFMWEIEESLKQSYAHRAAQITGVEQE